MNTLNEVTNIFLQMMEKEEVTIPIAVEAAIEAATKRRGAEAVYTWFAEITDHLALLAAKERDKRTNSIMKTFTPRG